MDYERFKEGFQDALKAELAVRGADVELTARRVDKMNESYDAITVRPMDSSIDGVLSVSCLFLNFQLTSQYNFSTIDLSTEMEELKC